MTVAAISQRLSLRAPQRTSLELLERLSAALALPVLGAHPERYLAVKNGDRAAQLAACQGVVPTLAGFDRDFPSFTFALATGVGKTRLMGASIAYLHQAHGVRSFFVVAPNLTIYEKLRTDFTPNTPKYVFEGLAEFAAIPPVLITGDDWETGRGVRGGDLFGEGAIHINIFNVARFATEDGRRVRRLHELIGESYFDYLAGLPDLALLMDESHRYRAATSAQALNDLKPLLGLEFTATPQVQSGTRATRFTNIAFEYKLGDAINDGFVKRPAVAGRRDFDASGFGEEQLDRIKLEDALVLHDRTKAELAAYARQAERPPVKPFVLVIARDTTHAAALQALIESPTFHGGIYSGRVITVHSNRTGAEKDEVIQRLLRVESSDEPTEIVIHVEMLKEGWDVTNLYTIVPLRAAQSRTLVEQSIGRGLRLPYGRPTGVAEVDRLTIVAHDKFKEIVDDAERADSPFRVEQVIVDPDAAATRTVAISVAPTVDALFGLTESPEGGIPAAEGRAPTSQPIGPLFVEPEDRRVASLTYGLLDQFRGLPGAQALQAPEQREALKKRVFERLNTGQLDLGAAIRTVDVERIVDTMIDTLPSVTIDVPRIILQPSGETKVSYRPFSLDASQLRYAAPSEEILVAELQSRRRELIRAGVAPTEERLEDYIVRTLMDEPDVDYDAHASLLYQLAGDAVAAIRAYAGGEDKVVAILVYSHRDIAAKIATQLRANRIEVPAEYVPEIRQGFTELHSQDRTAGAGEPVTSFRQTVTNRARIRQMRFGGFRRCLFPEQQFHSDGERRFAVLLEDESDGSIKWFRPGLRDIRLWWSSERQYVPDFIVETATERLMVEIKDLEQVEDDEVKAKARAAVTWCGHATAHASVNGGKPWRYLLIPDAAVVPTTSLAGLVGRFTVSGQ